jgi:hypothetical protein
MSERMAAGIEPDRARIWPANFQKSSGALRQMATKAAQYKARRGLFDLTLSIP